MNRSYKTSLILALAFVAAAASAYGLKKNPLGLFLLSGEGKAEVFRVRLSLGSGESVMEPIALNRAQAKKALEILKSRDAEALRSFGLEFGSFGSVLGLAGPKWEEDASWYFGGGWTAISSSRPEGAFDDLGWWDRAYFSLCAKPSTTPPVTMGGIEVDDLSTGRAQSPPALAATPRDPAPVGQSAQAGPLRVEIQNGCGIKGAADWVARRMKGHDLVIVGTGNADHFRYPKTLVKTTAGMPVVLEEALERLGLTKEAVEEVGSLSGIALGSTLQSSPVDLVVIVGRDFRQLKAKSKR